MSLDKHQFSKFIWKVLVRYGMHSQAALNLLLGTAAQESGFGTYIRQVEGPALGVFQMEYKTFEWLKEKYAHLQLCSGHVDIVDFEMLEHDLWLATILARLRYRAVPKALPPAENVYALAEYWKKHYNTHLGKGTVEQFVENYAKYVGDINL